MPSAIKLLKKFNPAVSKAWLLALAGSMWAGVGVMLCAYAYGWLTAPFTQGALIYAGLGLLIAVAANRWGFTHLAVKNIRRIQGFRRKVCLFAFQAWKGYAIIIGMILLGLILRHSPLPKPYLAVVYLAIGGALLQASLNYFARLRRLITQANWLRRAAPPA